MQPWCAAHIQRALGDGACRSWSLQSGIARGTGPPRGERGVPIPLALSQPPPRALAAAWVEYPARFWDGVIRAIGFGVRLRFAVAELLSGTVLLRCAVAELFRGVA